jgi:hypothetical protein
MSARPEQTGGGKPVSSFPPARGVPPSIEWQAVANLAVDPKYQRVAEKAVYARIASEWDWRLCAPLTISRRLDPAGLFVIDGQHRLEAARLRGDIPHLPCIISTFADLAEEAACFVDVNTKRRRISALDTFRAQLAACDPAVIRVDQLVRRSGLKIARHTNWQNWKAREISCVGGVKSALARYPEGVVSAALATIVVAWPDEPLQYSGRILQGLYPLIASPPAGFDLARFQRMVAGRKQSEWFAAMLRRQAKHGELPETAMYFALLDAWTVAQTRVAA